MRQHSQTKQSSLIFGSITGPLVAMQWDILFIYDQLNGFHLIDEFLHLNDHFHLSLIRLLRRLSVHFDQVQNVMYMIRQLDQQRTSVSARLVDFGELHNQLFQWNKDRLPIQALRVAHLELYDSLDY